jgi:ABC-type branched-subunit amino acid transport system substrate-binding protein
MRSGSTAPAGSRGLWRLIAVIAVVAASALAIAACGGDDSDSSSTSAGSTATPAGESSDSSTPAANKPTGDPIKVMTIAAVNWNGAAYPNILETAKTYEKYINDRGGIAGRPLQVTVCDEQGDPNQLATCGRNAVANKDVAVVGSFTLTGDRIVPILQQADTAWFGICCVISPAEQNSPITFDFGPQSVAGGAYAQKAIEAGCKNPSAVVLDIPTKNLFFDAQQRVLAASGVKLGAKVAIPVASADYAPQVAQATGGGADCIIGGLAENGWASFMPAFAQSGSKARLIGQQGNFDEKIAKGFPSIVAGDDVVGYYPDISSPVFKDYREALAQYKPDPDLDYNSLGGLGTWTAYVAFKNIVEKMNGPITAKTFLDAANKTTKLDTGGKLPELNLSKPWNRQPNGYKRIFNTKVTYSVFGDNGKLKVEQAGFFDVKKSALLAAGEK